MKSHPQGFKGSCEKRKGIENSCNSQRTWLLPKERFMMLHTFQVGSGPSIVPTSGFYVQAKKMLWHLLTESSFTPSMSKPFVIAMRLLLTS